MAFSMPPEVRDVERGIQKMMEEVARNTLLPKQKEAFLCCAKCCDSKGSMEDVQACIERCTGTSARAQKVLATNLNEFQERFQRCAMRCQDEAKEGMSFQPSSSDEERANGVFMSCMARCGKEFVGKIPKLKADIESQLKI